MTLWSNAEIKSACLHYEARKRGEGATHTLERAQLASADPARRDAREQAIYCEAETKAQRARRYGRSEDPWILLLICAQDFDTPQWRCRNKF